MYNQLINLRHLDWIKQDWSQGQNDKKEKGRGHNYRMRPLRKDNKLRVPTRGMGGGMELGDMSPLGGWGFHWINLHSHITS
jgi:hypothetical protein